jgi:hypothetical protein
LPASSAAAAAAAAAEVEGTRGGEGRGEALGGLRPADPNEQQPRRNATRPARREALDGAPPPPRGGGARSDSTGPDASS